MLSSIKITHHCAAQRILVQHENSTPTDGVAAWYDILYEYGSFKYISATITELQATLNAPYSNRVEGGLLGYIETIATAYVSLSNIDPTEKFYRAPADQQKSQDLTHRFTGTPVATDVFIILTTWKQNPKGTFESFLDSLKDWQRYHSTSQTFAQQTRAHAAFKEDSIGCEVGLHGREKTCTPGI